MQTENENQYRVELIQKYRKIWEPLFRYIPWLTEKRGTQTSHVYEQEGMSDVSLPIMVYDSTLLSFVKEAQATGLLDRNYIYALTRSGLRNVKDELGWIADAELQNIDVLFAIMAKYVLGGMTRGKLWTDAVESGVFADVLVKLKELLEVYEKPLA